MHTAVFSGLALGDGLIAMVLAHNLFLNGHKVVLFHRFLGELQSWFPHIPIQPYPPDLKNFERFFLICENTSWMQELLQTVLTKHRDKTTVLNPIATPNTDYRFWEEGRFNGSKPFAENLYLFCRNVLELSHAVRENGIVVPQEVTPKKYPHRIVLHPMSSRATKNWPKEKFLKLRQLLQLQGYDPCFIVAPHEKEGWEEAYCLNSLSELASFICESGYMIGNDSGIGHLASCLGVPTLTICRNARLAHFWRPSWAQGELCLPSKWLPNLKGLRLRDRFWQKAVSVDKVLHAFEGLR
ncbi:MAG TPA: glycosyltransferase family 9 protein [Rhabdochlamydiaceae bacterium]|nr:glycosyltransferase family 9 protein [Rhabdochlamydiaceae bacterium]